MNRRVLVTAGLAAAGLMDTNVVKAVVSWLQRHEIAVDEVCEHKPPALVYVDDRAVRFQGDWDD